MEADRGTVKNHSKEVERYLQFLSKTLMHKLDERGEDIKRIIANLEVDEQEYKRLVVREVIDKVFVEAEFAFPPLGYHAPEKVTEKALQLLEKFLARDKRLYCK